MPLGVVSQHAQEYMRPHAIGAPVADWTDVQIHRLQAAEGPLDVREILVGLHGLTGIELLGRNRGADDVETVKTRFRGNFRRVAPEAEVAISDVDDEVLAHLAAVQHRANRQADLGGLAQPNLALAADTRLDARQLAFGSDQQVLALACPFAGQIAIAADDQPLARELLRRTDLGEVAFVEQGWLQRPILGRQLLDRWGTQAGNPVQTGRLHGPLDPRRGDHAAVAHQYYPREAEALLELAQLAAQRRRIGGVAVKRLHRDRQPIACAQQAVDDLKAIATMVAGVAVPGQRAVAALEIR